jgi:hypothetical protein
MLFLAKVNIRKLQKTMHHELSSRDLVLSITVIVNLRLYGADQRCGTLSRAAIWRKKKAICNFSGEML